MEIPELVKTLVNQAGVKTVYSEPISVEGRTIVPVARVKCGFGGGGDHAGRGREEGHGGGGGGFVARPVGFVEVSSEGSRFVPIVDPQFFVLIAGLGLGLGFALGRALFRK